MKRVASLALLILIMSALWPLTTLATEGGRGAYVPGSRDFLAGLVPEQAGLFFRNEFYFYNGHISRTADEGLLQLDLDIFMFNKLFGTTFVMPGHFLKAKIAIGFNFLIAYNKVKVDVTTMMGSEHREKSQGGIGDFALNPLILGWNKRNVHVNLTGTLYLPSGKYLVGNVASLSRNYVTLDIPFGFTWYDRRLGLDTSFVTGFSINTTNEATDYHSGHAVHFETAFAKNFDKGIRLGFTSYGYIQVTPDSGSGAILGANKSRIFAMGPAFGYNFKFPDRKPIGSVFVKYTREFAGHRHIEGNVYQLVLMTPLALFSPYQKPTKQELESELAVPTAGILEENSMLKKTPASAPAESPASQDATEPIPETPVSENPNSATEAPPQ